MFSKTIQVLFTMHPNSCQYPLIKYVNPDQGEKKFFCDHCPRSFIFEASLKKHMNKIRARAIEPKKRKLSLQCDYCDAVLVTDYLTKVHYKNHHPNQPILAASQTRSSSSHVLTIPESTNYFLEIFIALFFYKFSIKIKNAYITVYHNRKRLFAAL